MFKRGKYRYSVLVTVDYHHVDEYVVRGDCHADARERALKQARREHLVSCLTVQHIELLGGK